MPIQHRIYTVLYPPDTETEDFVEEEKNKPAETRAISVGNQLITADNFAQKFVKALPE